MMHDPHFVQWLRTAQSCPLKVSACTGALLLGAAGFLQGKRATTHHNSFGDLGAFCTVVRDQRVVDEGDVITAGGVTASIDLGLYLCEKLAGRAARDKIAFQIEYKDGLEAEETIIRRSPSETRAY